MAKRKAAKRELINTGTDKRYVRRGRAGKFKESDDVGRSAAQDASGGPGRRRSGDRGTRATDKNFP